MHKLFCGNKISATLLIATLYRFFDDFSNKSPEKPHNSHLKIKKKARSSRTFLTLLPRRRPLFWVR